jgi:FkbM family methyltransferase
MESKIFRSFLALKEKVFKTLARLYPTQKISTSKTYKFFWKIIFAVFSPQQPFRFKTAYYEMIAVPEQGHLSRKVIRRGNWEPYETSIFYKYLKPGILVIDAGANFGHFSLIAANKIGEKGQVIAFEPEPVLFSHLKRNAELVAFNNITVINGALGEKETTAYLYFDAENRGGHSLTEKNILKKAHKIKVPLYQLDTFLEKQENHLPLGLMKLDTQGSEGLIFAGAWQSIQRDRPVIITEFCPNFLMNLNKNPTELLERFIKLGYRLSIIDEKREELIPVTSPDFRSWLSISNKEDVHLNLLLEP